MNAQVPLRKNRDFNLLWAGQVVSSFDTRIRDVAAPLLVLAITGSPGKGGNYGFRWGPSHCSS